MLTETMQTEVEKVRREYAAQSDDVPLAGYAASMLTFVTALGSALHWVRKTKSPLPGVLDVAMLGVATHKLSRIVSKEFVTAPIRAPFTRRQEQEGAGEVHDAPRGGLWRRTAGHLLTCPYCLGPWIATGVGTAVVLRPREAGFVIRVLAAVTVSDFLHLAYSRLNETRKIATAERKAITS